MPDTVPGAGAREGRPKDTPSQREGAIKCLMLGCVFGEVAVETASITESQQLRWTAGSVPARFYSKSTISSLRLEVCSIFSCIFFRGRSRGTERLSRTPEVTARGRSLGPPEWSSSYLGAARDMVCAPGSPRKPWLGLWSAA